MSHEHSHHHHHDHAPALARVSALSSGIAARLGIAVAAGAALWLTVWWALA